MNRRVTVYSEIKYVKYVIVAKASLNRACELYIVDPKPDDLSMSRMKLD